MRVFFKKDVREFGKKDELKEFDDKFFGFFKSLSDLGFVEIKEYKPIEKSVDEKIDLNDIKIEETPKRNKKRSSRKRKTTKSE